MCIVMIFDDLEYLQRYQLQTQQILNVLRQDDKLSVSF